MRRAALSIVSSTCNDGGCAVQQTPEFLVSNTLARQSVPSVRSVAEYLKMAPSSDALAAAASVDMLRKRYDDIAACYRLLAKEREH
jgi:hypothetical protein